MPSLETFQSNITNNITQNVTSIVMLFHGFRSAAKQDLTLAVFDIISPCSAVLHKRSRKVYKFNCQPFKIHNLKSMVPVKGIVLFSVVSGVNFFCSYFFKNVNILA